MFLKKGNIHVSLEVKQLLAKALLPAKLFCWLMLPGRMSQALIPSCKAPRQHVHINTHTQGIKQEGKQASKPYLFNSVCHLIPEKGLPSV